MKPQDTSRETRVMIVDSEALACQGLAALMAGTDDLTVVAATTDAQEAIDLAKRLRPDVAIIDPCLPALERLEVVSRISANDRTHVMFLDRRVVVVHLSAALQLGVSSYRTKQETFQDLADAIRQVVEGKTAHCFEVRRRLINTPAGFRIDAAEVLAPRTRLTKRELEVVLHLAQGRTVREAAKEMGLSTSTVDNHKSRLMKKLQLHKSVELVRLAIREGIIPPPSPE